MPDAFSNLPYITLHECTFKPIFFSALATPLIATIPTTVVPAIYHPVSKLCNWMKSTWDSWTDVPEDELEVVNGSDCYMRWC